MYSSRKHAVAPSLWHVLITLNRLCFLFSLSSYPQIKIFFLSTLIEKHVLLRKKNKPSSYICRKLCIKKYYSKLTQWSIKAGKNRITEALVSFTEPNRIIPNRITRYSNLPIFKSKLKFWEFFRPQILFYLYCRDFWMVHPP